MPWCDVRRAPCRSCLRADDHRAHEGGTHLGCLSTAKVQMVTQNTAKPRHPVLQSRDESTSLNFTLVRTGCLARCDGRVRLGHHFVSRVRARISPRIPAKIGTSRSSPCSRHGAHPSVPSCLVSVPWSVHPSASGSARHVTCRRATATRSAGFAVRVPRIAVRRFWRPSSGRPGARSRADSENRAKWRVAASPQPRRADHRCAASCLRRAGKVRLHAGRRPERSGGGAGGHARQWTRPTRSPHAGRGSQDGLQRVCDGRHRLRWWMAGQQRARAKVVAHG